MTDTSPVVATADAASPSSSTPAIVVVVPSTSMKKEDECKYELKTLSLPKMYVSCFTIVKYACTQSEVFDVL